MYLNQMGVNQKGKILHIFAGMKATQRLSGMGITPGTEIQKISQAAFHGPVQIRVRGTRLAIGCGLASKIEIKII